MCVFPKTSYDALNREGGNPGHEAFLRKDGLHCVLYVSIILEQSTNLLS